MTSTDVLGWCIVIAVLSVIPLFINQEQRHKAAMRRADETIDVIRTICEDLNTKLKTREAAISEIVALLNFDPQHGQRVFGVLRALLDQDRVTRKDETE